MNIEFIKSEFEKLTLILRSWKEDQNISTIERDIVLDKLKNIYDAVRFADAATAPAADAPATTAAAMTQTGKPMRDTSAGTDLTTAAAAPGTTIPDTEEADTEEEADEVEVEFIFSDDAREESADETAAEEQEEQEGQGDRKEQEIPEKPENSGINDNPESQNPGLGKPFETDIAAAGDTPAAATAAAASGQAGTAATDATFHSQPDIEPAVVSETEECPARHESAEAADDSATQDTQEETPTQAATPQGEPERAQRPQHPMNSLFGANEVKRSQPSRHHRMMSIYDYDTESKPEKVVDISKIFENDDYAPDARYESDTYETPEYRHNTPAPQAAESEPVRIAAPEESVTTLADAMSGSQHTLADTLAGPEPLAEQITHRATTSLRDAIGINDKFLLMRDLFDGDEKEYDKAIGELDSFDNLDDCMIHIVENYAWNPNSEGAKFIMQLLERKLS